MIPFFAGIGIIAMLNIHSSKGQKSIFAVIGIGIGIISFWKMLKIWFRNRFQSPNHYNSNLNAVEVKSLKFAISLKVQWRGELSSGCKNLWDKSISKVMLWLLGILKILAWPQSATGKLRQNLEEAQKHIQPADIGWPTGNGKKLSKGQACCLA